MAGHMGNVRVTTQNLEVVQTDKDRGLILVRGAVPGTKGDWVLVRDAVKRALPENAPKPGIVPQGGPRASFRPSRMQPARSRRHEGRGQDIGCRLAPASSS